MAEGCGEGVDLWIDAVGSLKINLDQHAYPADNRTTMMNTYMLV